MNTKRGNVEAVAKTTKDNRPWYGTSAEWRFHFVIVGIVMVHSAVVRIAADWASQEVLWAILLTPGILAMAMARRGQYQILKWIAVWLVVLFIYPPLANPALFIGEFLALAATFWPKYSGKAWVFRWSKFQPT